MLDFYTLFLYFFIYSVLGWCAEIIYCAICQGKIVDRGFLFGPYCPIYGFGGTLVVVLLNRFIDTPIIVFLLSLLFATILEYITSYTMEKIFKAKWWDYSNFKLNLNGRICLLNSIEFGLLGITAIYFIHPLLTFFLNIIPIIYYQSIVTTLLLLISIDFTFTINNLINLEEKLTILKDLTESIIEKQNGKISEMEIFKQLEEFRKNFIIKKSNFSNRIIEAFPDLSFNKLNKQFNELKLELHKKQLEGKEIIKNKFKKENK